MVRTIPHRELRNNSSRILEAVRNGETIHITNHGEIVATLIPPPLKPPPPRIIPARNPGGWADIAAEPHDGEPIDQADWDEVREERF